MDNILKKYITKGSLKNNIYYILAFLITIPLFFLQGNNHKNTTVVDIFKFYCEMIVLYAFVKILFLSKGRNPFLKAILTHKKKIASISIAFVGILNAYIMIDTIMRVLVTEKAYSYFCNILLYFTIYLFFYIFTNSFKATILIGSVISTIFLLVNYFLVIFRGKALFASDLLALKTAYSVSGSYNYVLNSEVVGYLIYIVAFVLAALGMIKEFELKSHKVYWKRKVIAMVALTGFYVVFYQTDVISSMGNATPSYWSHERNGFLFNFLMQTKDLVVKVPDGYDVKNIEQVKNNQKNENASGEKPNIIVIMNESFTDFNAIGKLKTNIEVTPFLNNLSKNTIKGKAHVSVYGGMTANSEFEFLTGDSMLMYHGTVPYQMYIRNQVDTVVSTMKASGYRTIAMHPYYSSCYNRKNIYQYFGFDQVYFINDFEKKEMLRACVSDQCLYDKIIENYENKAEDEKIFSFNVTMQNHGGYEIKYKNFDEKIYLSDCKGKYPQAEQALSLIHESDRAIEALVSYFQKQKEHTIIVFFGDHQPNVEKEFYELLYGKKIEQLTIEEQERKYQTPYFIWANYDIKEDVRDLSLNYLSSVLLKTANVKMSGYQNYLWELYQKYPIINGLEIVDNHQKVFTTEEGKKVNEINLYQQIMYNHLIDKNNIIKDFFTVR